MLRLYMDVHVNAAITVARAILQMHNGHGRDLQEWPVMKSFQVELPDKLAQELRVMVRTGWFRSEDEVIRFALLEFVRHHHLGLLEKFQHEDISWAVQQKSTS